MSRLFGFLLAVGSLIFWFVFAFILWDAGWFFRMGDWEPLGRYALLLGWVGFVLLPTVMLKNELAESIKERRQQESQP